jgi:hypothetical protein
VIGLSAEDTAEVMGSTAGAGLVTQHRAYSRLRAAICRVSPSHTHRAVDDDATDVADEVSPSP